MKPKIYLAGSIEYQGTEKKYSNWRQQIGSELELGGFEILDPTKLEKEQLKGVKLSRLPKEFVGQDGVLYYPKHWHDLKNAKYGSHWYLKFQDCMEAIIKYDINIVENVCDAVYVLWTEATARGAGTHAELTSAVLKQKPVVLVKKTATVPSWAMGCTRYGLITESFEEATMWLDAWYQGKKV